jgi:hypothetical protein
MSSKIYALSNALASSYLSSPVIDRSDIIGERGSNLKEFQVQVQVATVLVDRRFK